MLTRNRNSKIIRARAGSGRFKRATLADLGVNMQPCASCRRFFENRRVDEQPGGFAFPVRITKCPHCGHDHRLAG